MTITWYGHSCFRFESKGVSILVDPFSKEIGLRPPRMAKDNIIMATHEHSDHNNIGDQENALIIRGPGEYEKSGVQMEGVSSFHDEEEGKLRGLNTIYVIRTEDIKLCHLGDLGQTELSEEQLDIIGDIDILLIPVGGKYTIDGKQAVKIVSQIDPKIVIPMHYKIKDLKVDVAGPEQFLKEIGIKPEQVEGGYKINSKTLPVDETKLVMFKI
ncbi:MAG: MBL fold metallo-hydrolase [bacterium]|nr:MBL fold metallo-hydrolase [bacterium]